MDETVVAWDDDRGYTLNLHNGEWPRPPFKWATFQYHLADAPCGQTLLRAALQRCHAALGINMKKFYETDQVTNPASP